MKRFSIPSRLRGESGRFAGDLGFKMLTEVCNALFGLLTFAIISRLLAEKSDYAVINQIIAVSSLISPILLVKMNNAFCVFLAGETDRTRIKSRFFSVMLLCLPVCAVLTALAVLWDKGLSQLMFDSPDYSGLMLLMGGYFVVLSLSTLCQSLYQATGRQKKSNVFVIVRGALTTGSFALLMAFPDRVSLENMLWLYFLTESIVMLSALICIFWDYRDVPLKPEFRPLKEYYRYALPLMPSVIMSWINSFIGRFMLNHMMDLDVSGTYSFYASLVSRAFFVNAVLVYTIFPYVAKFWNQNNKAEVSRYLVKAFHIGVEFGLPASLGLVITAPTLIRLMSDSHFEYAPTVMLWLCLASVFQMLYMNFSYLIDLSRRTGVYNVIFFISSLLNVLFNLWLIPPMGMEGAALAMMLSYLVQLLVTVWIGTRSAGLRVVPDWRQIVKTIAASGAMYLVCSRIYTDTLPCFILTAVVGVAIYAGVMLVLSKLTKTSLL